MNLITENNRIILRKNTVKFNDIINSNNFFIKVSDMKLFASIISMNFMHRCFLVNYNNVKDSPVIYIQVFTDKNNGLAFFCFKNKPDFLDCTILDLENISF